MASPFVPPTIPGAAGYPLGLTGAAAATRYVGATASGAPASGTFAVGDFIIDQSGAVYVCTVAGSPGTWTAVAGGGTALLFDSTLTGDAASIDTGANGIAGGYASLEVTLICRTTEAVARSGVQVVLNNDAGANYDQTRVQNLNATVSGASSAASTNIGIGVFGASASANAATAIKLVIPNYAGTTFHKAGTSLSASADATVADMSTELRGFLYRSTSAITRLKVTAQSGNLLTGSRLSIIGIGQ